MTATTCFLILAVFGSIAAARPYLRLEEMDELISAGDCSGNAVEELNRRGQGLFGGPSRRLFSEIREHLQRCGASYGERLASDAMSKLTEADLRPLEPIERHIGEDGAIVLTQSSPGQLGSSWILVALKALAQEGEGPLNQFHANHLQPLEQACRKLKTALNKDLMDSKRILAGFIPSQQPPEARRLFLDETICNFYEQAVASKSIEWHLSPSRETTRGAIDEIVDSWPGQATLEDLTRRVEEVKLLEGSIKEFFNKRLVGGQLNEMKLRKLFQESVEQLRDVCDSLESLEQLIWLTSAGVRFELDQKAQKYLSFSQACETLPRLDFDQLETSWVAEAKKISSQGGRSILRNLWPVGK